ncbi:MAG TPA: hypothetical protein VL172_20085 [Kofleriaceae bacterium]|nr:hypothetical protein [Kofleriaceae bacterium]
MNLRTHLLALLLLPAACGDDAAVNPDAAPPAPDADPSAPDAGPPTTSTVFAVGTDYFSAGISSTVVVPSLALTQNAVEGVASTDPVVRRFGERIYVINRYGFDNVTILDAGDLQLVAQISTGAGTNPWDVAVVGDRIYVAALNAGGLLVIDASRPDDGVIDRVDLPALDLEDGNPNCNAVAVAGDRLYAACGLLDDNDMWLTPRGPGKLVSIDLADDSVDGTVHLISANPQGQILVTPSDGPLGGDLLIDTVNYFDLTAGCLERVSPGPAPRSNGCLIQHADLGGIVTGAAWTPDDRIYLAVTTGWDPDDYQPLGKVMIYDATTGTLSADAMTPDTERPFDLALCPTGHIAIADAAGGLRIYDPTGTEMTPDLLDLGLPPVSGGLTCY